MNSTPARQMTSQQKKAIGIQAFTQHTTITDIANQNNASRQFIYNQKKRLKMQPTKLLKKRNRTKKYSFICR